MSLKITPVDEAKESEGVVRDYFGVKLTIARAENDRYVKAFRRYHAQAGTPVGKKLDSELLSDLTMKSMAEAVLLGWEGFSFNGEEVPYSHEAAYELLKNDRDVREFVSGVANDLDNYLKEDSDQALGE